MLRLFLEVATDEMRYHCLSCICALFPLHMMNAMYFFFLVNILRLAMQLLVSSIRGDCRLFMTVLIF